MMIPYTPSEEIANRYRMPTLMSAITSPSPTGITAQATIASTKVSIGAMMNTTRLAPAGRIVSLANSFRPSASGCSRPNGPTLAGPVRSCMPAITLRSASVR